MQTERPALRTMREQSTDDTDRTVDEAKPFSDTARDFGEDVERAKAISESENPKEDMTEHVRYKKQGAEFRVVSRKVSQLEVVYIEKKRSCDDSWEHEKKLGWRSIDANTPKGNGTHD